MIEDVAHANREATEEKNSISINAASIIGFYFVQFQLIYT